VHQLHAARIPALPARFCAYSDCDRIAFSHLIGNRRYAFGSLRDWLRSDEATPERQAALAPGLTPEMVAAASKLMRVQDLIAAARKMRVVTRFRTTLGLKGRLSARLQPNRPADSLVGIAASILDGLLMDSGDAVVGINPAGDHVRTTAQLPRMMDELRQRFEIPMQSCALAHITTQMAALKRSAPADLLFQSLAGALRLFQGAQQFLHPAL
jgi:ethanolamine ammonia-lyase large subunit